MTIAINPEAKARACLSDATEIKQLDGQVAWPQVEQSLKAAGA